MKGLWRRLTVTGVAMGNSSGRRNESSNAAVGKRPPPAGKNAENCINIGEVRKVHNKI